MRSCSENYQRDAYILKLDISGFFMSIDRERLLEKIQDLICPMVSFLRRQESRDLDPETNSE
jgi:RNA-directed DNA polymerase